MIIPIAFRGQRMPVAGLQPLPDADALPPTAFRLACSHLCTFNSERCPHQDPRFSCRSS